MPYSFAATSQCDWPDTVNCEYNAIALTKVKSDPTEATTLYLTFDDGPNEGTAGVLDALKKFGVRATFFVNSDNLEVSPRKDIVTLIHNLRGNLNKPIRQTFHSANYALI